MNASLSICNILRILLGYIVVVLAVQSLVKMRIFQVRLEKVTTRTT